MSRLPSVISRTFSFYRYGSNVRVQTEARLGADSLEPLVRSLCFSKVDVLNGIASVEKDKEGSG